MFGHSFMLLNSHTHVVQPNLLTHHVHHGLTLILRHIFPFQKLELCNQRLFLSGGRIDWGMLVETTNADDGKGRGTQCRRTHWHSLTTDADKL